MSDPLLLLRLLILVGTANFAPILGKRLLGERFAVPLDGGLVLADGRRLLGRSKTWRGLALALAATAAAGAIIGPGPGTGLVLAAGAMAGDAFSSFLKRRLGHEPHAQALGIDQIPESLLPLLLVAGPLGLGALDIILSVAVFFAAELVLSRALFALGIRDRPY